MKNPVRQRRRTRGKCSRRFWPWRNIFVRRRRRGDCGDQSPALAGRLTEPYHIRLRGSKCRPESSAQGFWLVPRNSDPCPPPDAARWKQVKLVPRWGFRRPSMHRVEGVPQSWRALPLPSPALLWNWAALHLNRCTSTQRTRLTAKRPRSRVVRTMRVGNFLGAGGGAIRADVLRIPFSALEGLACHDPKWVCVARWRCEQRAAPGHPLGRQRWR